jgi:predicted DNA-binding transcriptional regulator AlpA
MSETSLDTPRPLDQSAVAERSGLALATIRRYHMVAEQNRAEGTPKPGDLPPPDGHAGRSPYWFPATIDPWIEQRPRSGDGNAGRPTTGREPDHLQKVADLYRAAEEAVRSAPPQPVDVISDHYNVSRVTAYRWIREARAEGLIE